MKLRERLRRLVPVKVYYCAFCHNTCFDVRTVRSPVKHKTGYCIKCTRWVPVRAERFTSGKRHA